MGVLLAVIAAACGDGDSGEGSAAVDSLPTDTTEVLGDPVTGGEITVGLESEGTSWLPGQASWDNAGQNVAMAIYDPLAHLDAEGRVQPYLAESIEPNEALTEWTVTLRPGVTFHDGTPLDAATMKTIFDDYLKAPGSTAAGSIEEVSELRVDGDLTFTYLLTEPNAAFPDLLRTQIGYPFSVKKAQADGESAGEAPAGTGPFMIENWARDDRLELVRNPDYWREGLPYLDKITFRPIPDETARVQSLLTNSVDGIQSLRGTSIKEVIAAESEGFTAHTQVSDDASVVLMNVLRPPYDDVRIRKALAHTVDQEAFGVVLGDDGLADPATQLFSPDSPWYSERVAEAYVGFDMDKAKELVQEYVNDPDRSDGKAVGQPPELDFGCLPDATTVELAVLIEANASEAGFDVELSSYDQATMIARTFGTPDSDPPYIGDYQVACFRIVSYGDPANSFHSNFGPPEELQSNWTNYHDEEITRLTEQLRTTLDFEERYELVEQIGVIVNENAPLAYGVGTSAMMGVRDEIKNVMGWTIPDAGQGSGIPFGIAMWGEVWLDEEG